MLIEGRPGSGAVERVKEFKPGRGMVTVYIYDYAGSYTLIGISALDLPDWQNGNADWQLQKFSLADISYMLPAGHALTDRDRPMTCWAKHVFAYDTGRWVRSAKSRRFFIPCSAPAPFDSPAASRYTGRDPIPEDGGRGRDR